MFGSALCLRSADCGKEAETIQHLIFFCEWVQVTLFMNPLILNFNCFKVSTFEDSCFSFLSSGLDEVDEWSKYSFATQCWII